MLVAVLLSAIPPGRAVSAAVTADDPAWTGGLQWALEIIGAPAAWQRGDGTGITVAVVDTGVDLAHPDLAGRIAGSVSCIGSGGDPDRCGGPGVDDHGHGTHVAGIVAATTGNGTGVASVAPGARLLAVRVLQRACDTCSEATGTSGDVEAGIRWAVRNGARVINLSLGSTTQAVFGPGFATAVREAWDAGVIVVVAAGNDFVLSSGFSDEPAIVVTATNRDDQRATYSNMDLRARWAMAAPGGEPDTATTCTAGGRPLGILSTWWDPDTGTSTYACQAGTSMAAPHVAGAAAVLLGLGLSPSETVDRLLDTAVDLGPPGRDTVYGAGRLDLSAATEGLGAPGTPSTTADAGGTGPADTTEPPPAPSPTPPAPTTTDRGPPSPPATARSTTTAPPAPAGPTPPPSTPGTPRAAAPVPLVDPGGPGGPPPGGTGVPWPAVVVAVTALTGAAGLLVRSVIRART